MQAVILAGGLGTRLRPLTYEVPKPMVPIHGKPYLAHQLAVLRAQGFDDVVLLTGYLGEQIEEYFGNGEAVGLRLRYSREMSPIGTGGALLQALPLLAPSFLLLYGDSFLPIRYGEVLGLLEPVPFTQLVLTAYDNGGGNTSVNNNLYVDAAGRVAAYEKGTDNPQLNYVEAGVLALRRDALALLPDTVPVSLEHLLFPRLIADGQVRAFLTTERFYDFGTPERLAETESFFRSYTPVP